MTELHRTPRILCLGMPVRDLVFRVGELPVRGHKMHATQFTEQSGGNALNAAIGIVRLGGAVLFAGPMGDREEKASAYIYDELEQEGIDASGIVPLPGRVAPISNIMIDAGGERTIVTYRDPTLWDVDLGDPDSLLRGCDAVLTENRCASFVSTVCATARRHLIPVVLDADQKMTPNDGMLTACSHIIFSVEALRATTGLTDEDEALRLLSNATPAFLAVTAGHHGVTWLDAGGAVRHMPSFQVETIDTLGAGDIFHGAFALAIAEGQTIEDAMRFAAAAAAIKCTRYGGAFAAPHRNEVMHLLAGSKAFVGTD